MSRNFLSKTLKLLATGSLSVFMAACYGPPAIFDKTVRFLTNNNEPIRDLQITLLDQNGEGIAQEISDQGGYVTFDYGDIGTCDALLINDTDGEANGGYFGTDVEKPFDPEQSYQEIELEPLN